MKRSSLCRSLSLQLGQKDSTQGLPLGKVLRTKSRRLQYFGLVSVTMPPQRNDLSVCVCVYLRIIYIYIYIWGYVYCIHIYIYVCVYMITYVYRHIYICTYMCAVVAQNEGHHSYHVQDRSGTSPPLKTHQWLSEASQPKLGRAAARFAQNHMLGFDPKILTSALLLRLRGRLKNSKSAPKYCDFLLRESGIQYNLLIYLYDSYSGNLNVSILKPPLQQP